MPRPGVNPRMMAKSAANSGRPRGGGDEPRHSNMHHSQSKQTPHARGEKQKPARAPDPRETHRQER